jgi:hypothetical protein
MNPINTIKNIDPKLQQVADAIDAALREVGFETVSIQLGMDIQTQRPYVEARVVAPIATEKERH